MFLPLVGTNHKDDRSSSTPCWAPFQRDQTPPSQTDCGLFSLGGNLLVRCPLSDIQKLDDVCAQILQSLILETTGIDQSHPITHMLLVLELAKVRPAPSVNIQALVPHHLRFNESHMQPGDCHPVPSTYAKQTNCAQIAITAFGIVHEV